MSLPTREEILAEPAGPRMDAWVAEHVMGWSRSTFFDPSPGWVGKEGFWVGWWTQKPPMVENEYGQTVVDTVWVVAGDRLWNPSEDIAAAWQVIAAIRGKIFSRRLAFHNALREIIPTPDGGVVAWPWALMHLEPIHICRAAVAAMRPHPLLEGKQWHTKQPAPHADTGTRNHATP